MHIPSIYSHKLSTLVKRQVGPKFQTFCDKTGGKPVPKNDLTCTGEPGGRPVCAIPRNTKNVRGVVKCLPHGTLQVNFSDCDKNKVKPKVLFCEAPVKAKPLEVSCKEGATGTAVKDPPQITCVVSGGKPSTQEPQCAASTPNSFDKFSGKIQCQKGATLTFKGGASKGLIKGFRIVIHVPLGQQSAQLILEGFLVYTRRLNLTSLNFSGVSRALKDLDHPTVLFCQEENLPILALKEDE
ncbi:uncharacterized protein MELLADRAFT_69217 [Melampsora larici-populina 98AG31]|uniref:Uncharacterized protein n=1 Tax=Melampsora larici-populina (strain 98AG31 / pathotype 3-4-7) TaxID=747676 RepID=F4S9U4_MELLP|nr:uncharacterized protein MELLADRAFT_69217 [Melampsora larici-populina 98AG31]EGF98599.1 hypothetical protein MELLADRAFT_69217 [Melampsora larici-populina 98AG31]